MRRARAVGLLRKLRRLRAAEAAALAEALVLVVLAAPAVRFVPFRMLGRIASRPIAGPPPDPARRRRLVVMIGWAVDRAARRSPLRALCFERGLAAQLMLRRRGIDATLFYGVAPGRDAPLAAHVWVRDGETGVVGTENAGEFAALARFPAR